MDRRRSIHAEEREQDDPASLTRSLQHCFSSLIEIFDRQLASDADAADRNWSKISEARAAAERGLRLTEHLGELLAKDR